MPDTDADMDADMGAEAGTKAGEDTTAAGGATAGLDGKRLAAGNVDRVIRIPATGKETKIEDVYFTCAEGPEDCVITIPAGESVHTVSYTGGTLTASATKAPPETSDPPETGNWLSASSLVGALDADGGAYGITVGGVKVNLGVANAVTDKVVRGATAANLDPKVTSLTLEHNRDDDGTDRDFLVWGVWQEPVEGTAPSKPRSVAGGSMPYTGTFPASGDNITDGVATYAEENVFHGFVNGTYFMTDVRLTADFGDKTISGTIGNINTDAAAEDADLGADINSISLKNTGIGASMSGSATIVGSGAESTEGAKLAPSRGTWKAGFYGPASGAPTGIAGEVSVTRPAAGKTLPTAVNPHSRVTAVTVNGAFGAPVCTDATGACAP